MRAVLLVAFLVVALPVQAGSEEEPEIEDASGDQELPVSAADLQKVWFTAGQFGPWGEDRFSALLALQVGEIDPSAAVDYEVSWKAANALDPATVTSERGVRIFLRAGSATYAPIAFEDGAWVEGGRGAAVVDPAGRIDLTILTTGGGAIPTLSSFRAESRVAESTVLLDEASGDGPWTKTDLVAVTTNLSRPDREPDLESPPDEALPGAVDLLAGWTETQPGAIVNTFKVRDLQPTGVLGCDWFDVNFARSQFVDEAHLSLYAFDSIRVEDGVITFPFLSADRSWDPPRDNVEVYDPEGTVEVYFPTTWRVAWGSPGYIEQTIHAAGASPVWNGTAPLSESYRSMRLACRNEFREDYQDGVSEGNGLPDFDFLVPAPAWAPWLALAVAVLLRRRP